MIQTAFDRIKKNRSKSAIFFNTNPKHHFNLKSGGSCLVKPGPKIANKKLHLK
jgi:hypothetical protein